MIRVGTSGYSYADWHGPFYPTDLAARDRFAWYTRHFGCVEVNSSYYRQPTPRAMERLVAQAPAGFEFAIKAYGGITHDHEQVTAGDFAVFARAVEPLWAAGRLAGILAQFPSRFRPTRATCDLLRRLRAEWPEYPIAVEFRHRDWLDERAFALLERHDLAFCCVDEPALDDLLPPVVKITAKRSYLRFHGRNAARWYHHHEAWERYDYCYTPEELSEWVPRIKGLAELADALYVFFNNHYEAQAVTNARELATELGVQWSPASAGGAAEGEQ